MSCDELSPTEWFLYTLELIDLIVAAEKNPPRQGYVISPEEQALLNEISQPAAGVLAGLKVGCQFLSTPVVWDAAPPTNGYINPTQMHLTYTYPVPHQQPSAPQRNFYMPEELRRFKDTISTCKWDNCGMFIPNHADALWKHLCAHHGLPTPPPGVPSASAQKYYIICLWSGCGHKVEYRGRSATLARHIQRCHFRMRDLLCPHCPKVVFHPKEMREHIRKNHPGKKNVDIFGPWLKDVIC
ncbi:hypothetical protein NLJ89_g4647 [Agrocybe chaxingu]|uniref:C2H2-type domain-containing protein n=1 Tax=Agrocybe chaxingu TaxID=84603 RepID=A0A9W8MVR6_9AGAR|nr:hypothetical protein NLJ89_g4647 [Agrocybe chaxingu]